MPTSTYTIKEWLKGMAADFDVSDQTLRAILYNNGLSGDTDVADVSEKSKDLSLADLYMSLASSSSKSGSIYDSDGGWQRGRATKNVVDRSWFRDRANDLYKKWAPEKVVTHGKIVLKNLY